MFLGWAVVSTATRLVFTNPMSDQALKQHRLDLLHPCGPDPVPKLHQGSGFQNLTALEGVESAKALPVGILMEHLHCPFVGAVVAVLQYMDADHQANGLPLTAQGTVVST